MRTALIDVDGMVHAAGALGEEVFYTIDDGSAVLRFDYKSQANTHCDDNNIPRGEIERKVDALPVSHAINIINQMINAAIEAAGCDQHAYEMYLSPTDKSNFRFAINPDYKANRKNVVKPVHFNALRRHVEQHRGAIVCPGMEADDMLCIRAHELGMDEVVIVSVDKDMRQVPCWHYDYRKKGPVSKVEPVEGWMNFYTQLLVGDSVDNIKGCPKIGPAKAGKALKGITDDTAMLNVCMELYQAAYDGDAVEGAKALKMNAELLLLLDKRPA